MSEQVGEILHDETSKPDEQRLTDLAAAITTVSDKVEKERVVAEMKKMIAVSTAAQKKDSQGAIVSKKEETVVYFDAHTNTFWYAKLDSTDLKKDERGAFLNVIDQKAGRYRSAMQLSSVFFQAYVAKMAQAFGHTGPVRYAVRYLRDRFGTPLNTPEERGYWLNRRLNEHQDQSLYGIQVTIQKMEQAWKAKEFPAETGRRCATCQFATSCQAGLNWQAEQVEQARQEREDREDSANDNAIAAGASVTTQNVQNHDEYAVA